MSSNYHISNFVTNVHVRSGSAQKLWSTLITNSQRSLDIETLLKCKEAGDTSQARNFPIFLLREKYPNTDQKKLRIWTIFTQCL